MKQHRLLMSPTDSSTVDTGKSDKEQQIMTDDDSILNVDQEIEPIVSMRDSILTYLTVLMENEVDPKTTSDEQYDCMLQCLKISCDIAVQCKESYRTYNTGFKTIGMGPITSKFRSH